MPDQHERMAALKRQSDGHLALAHRKASEGLQRDAAASAFEAGYFALMAALSADEARSFDDHPSPAAAELGATRLGLGWPGRRLVVEGTSAFYSPDREVFAGKDWFAWAAQARLAAGWNG